MAGDRDAQWTEQVLAAQRGDRAAWAALYAGFARTVHAIALAHVGSQGADDVSQVQRSTRDKVALFALRLFRDLPVPARLAAEPRP